jgi:NADPH:quinone reductase-like Zn-dependent oxidoreductase
MHAALVREHGTGLEVGERDEPQAGEGRVVVELRAAAINPVDVAIASGRFYGGSPPLPYVPGAEAVGAVAGRRVYATGGGLGVATDGTFAERFAAREDLLIDVPEGLDDALAVAIGIAGVAAWVPLTRVARLAEGESVLVLGATGTLGSVAIQAARVLGASRVVGVGRDPERLAHARELGADAVVSAGGDLVAGLREAFGDAGPDVVVDATWGAPVEAAVAVAARGARLVQIGASAGNEATLPSAAVRGKQLRIEGFSSFALAPADLARAYRELAEHAGAGRIRVAFEAFPLERAPEAWRRHLEGGTKVVVIP